MILADKPLWPWRGQLWGHLVSDTSLEELHEFARQLGKRRIGFQGDHYDLNPTEHARALEAGAVSVDSRELVRRLRNAGLRDRSKKLNWNISYRSDRRHTLAEVAKIVAVTISDRSMVQRFNKTLASVSPKIEVLEVLMVERPSAAALVLELNEVPQLDLVLIDLSNPTQHHERHVLELIIGEP